MMRKTFSILLLIFSASANLIAQDKIVPFLNKGKWGFMNSKKEIIVCPQFDEAYPPYASNLCRIKINGKYGFIDFEGNDVIKTKYDTATDFEYGLSTVTKKGKTFAIQPTGKKFEGINGICGTHYCMRPSIRKTINIYEVDSKFGFTHPQLNKTDSIGNETVMDSIPAIFNKIVPITHQLMYLVKDSMMAFLHEGSIFLSSEHILDNLIFSYQYVELFSCFMCKDGYNDMIGFKKNGLWGYGKYYIGSELNEIIEAKYFKIAPLSKGYAMVEFEKGKFGYIDYQGNEYFIR